VSCLNTACVFGLSIMCLVSILHVFLVSPLYVLPQYCLCLWFGHHVSYLNTACVWFVHFRSCLNTACVSGLSMLCIVSMLHMSLVCRFVNFVSCLNNACISGLFILCALSQCLSESLVCPFCVRSQKYLCLCFVHSLFLVPIVPVSLVCQFTLSCLNTVCVSGFSILFLVSILPVSLVCPWCVLF
jgi:hypothetical protein